jgi:MFS family permease
VLIIYQMESVLLRIKDFLGLKRNIIFLLCIIILVGTGEKTWERFIPEYLRGLDASFIVIGGFGFLQNILNAFWALSGGYLADKFGNRKAFLAFNLMAVFGYIIAVIFTNWVAVFIGMLFFSAWSALSLPASMSLITKTLKGKKTAMGISMHSIIRRFPMMLGPLIGGSLITAFGLIQGIKIAFIISIILCLVSIFFQNKMTEENLGIYEKINPVLLWKKFDKRLKNLLVSDVLIRFCEQIPYVFVIIWCINIVNISPLQFGYLTAIEMLTAAVIYIPVANFSDRFERKPFVALTFLFFTIFPLFLYYSRNYLFLIFAFIIRGLKEFGEPTRKAMIMDFASKGLEARSVGLYYFIRDLIVSFAAFGGGFLWKMDPALNLFTAFAFGISGTIYFILFGRGTRIAS